MKGKPVGDAVGGIVVMRSGENALAVIELGAVVKLRAGGKAVAELELEGEIQVASFHPDYRFADTEANDVTNCTNRSPLPTLHLLREASVERAIRCPARLAAMRG